MAALAWYELDNINPLSAQSATIRRVNVRPVSTPRSGQLNDRFVGD